MLVRSLLFLLAAACTASDATETTSPTGGGKADDSTTTRAVTSVLGQLLTDDAIQDALLADGFELASIKLEEADDGGTEPLFDIVVVNWAEDTRRCFTLWFDTDVPFPADARIEQHPLTECE